MSNMWGFASWNQSRFWKKTAPSLKTNIVPENGWLEDDISFWDPAYFHRAILVSGSFSESLDGDPWSSLGLPAQVWVK